MPAWSRHAGAYLCGIHGDSADRGSYPDHPDPAVLRLSAGRQLLAGADTHGISAEDSVRGSASGRSGRKPSHCDSGGQRCCDLLHYFLCKTECGLIDQ